MITQLPAPVDGCGRRRASRIPRRATRIGIDARVDRPDRIAHPSHPVLLDIAEAALLLGVSRAKLYEGPIKRGELVTVLIDSRRLVPRPALDA